MSKLAVLCSCDSLCFSLSLDKILGAITTAAERHNREERFSQIVEGLENHEFIQLQVSLYFRGLQLKLCIAW